MSREQDKRAIDGSPTNRQTVHNAVERFKDKTKGLLHLDHNEDDSPKTRTPLETAQNDLDDNPAFNPDKFLSDTKPSTVKFGGKVLSGLGTVAGAVIHPKQTIKLRATRTAARKLSKGRPYISRKADLDFLDAYDEQLRAESSRSGSDDEETAGVKDGRIRTKTQVADELQERRQSMRVAWVTNRHVQRVKVIERLPGRLPKREFFEEKKEDGGIKFRYDKWLAYPNLLFYTHRFTVGYIDDFEDLPFSLNALRRHVERLIIVSDPAQVIISRIMKVYRWENPWETGRWLALYIFLWYTSHIIPFFYAYFIYRVLRNFFAPASLQDLRESIQRTMDRGSTAFKIAELMDRHGNEDWLDPLVEQLGPTLQLQINDLANMLEVLDNFYNWKSPSMTLATLFFIFVCLLISLLADTKFCLKILYFISGMSFFGGFPISSRYPKYRHLVSPPKWCLWDIPTHAEWSIMYLQERANTARQAFQTRAMEDQSRDDEQTDSGPCISIDDDSSSDESFESAIETAEGHLAATSADILSFTCTYNLIPGRLIISSHGFRFRSSISRHGDSDARFSYPYSRLHQMRKCHTTKKGLISVSKGIAGFDKLEIFVLSSEDTDFILGEPRKTTLLTLDNMRGRDKAFNAILGFSGLKWQNLMAGWE